jgi:hypothetical protein
VDAEVQLALGGDARDRRQLGPTEAMPDHRGLADRGPCLGDEGDEGEPALVYKQERRPTPRSPLLMAGQV